MPKAVEEIPSHSHTATTNTSGAHTHTYQLGYYRGSGNLDLGGDGTVQTLNTGSAGNHAHVVTVASTGGSKAHQNMPPFLSIYCWKRVS